MQTRVAECGGKFYYDLCDAEWRVVEISEEGWKITNQPRPIFRRYSHQLAQTVSETETQNLDDFLGMFKIRDTDKLLIKVWLVCCFIPDIPHPILVLHGGQGSAKSTFFRMCRTLVDPSALAVLSFPSDKMELIQKLAHHYFAPFDNVSSIGSEVSDVLCRACTGEGFSKRKLYSDDEDVVYAYKRCVLLGGINIAATRADLLDRAMLFGFERISKKHRKTEKVLDKQLEAMRPKLLAEIFGIISRAMSIKPDLKTLPRMADFGTWGEAVARAMGEKLMVFEAAYSANLDKQHIEVVDASPIGQCLLVFISENSEGWQGSASDLLSKLEEIAQKVKIKTNDKYFPKAPHILMRRLNEMKANLEELGIDITSDHDGKERTVLVKKVMKESVSSVIALETQEIAETGTNKKNATEKVALVEALAEGNNATEVKRSEIALAETGTNTAENKQTNATNATNAILPTPLYEGQCVVWERAADGKEKPRWIK
ncbi:MAG: hypothetical protein V1676_03800 [Candidatus Diapherotrites archaeon]